MVVDIFFSALELWNPFCVGGGFSCLVVKRGADAISLLKRVLLALFFLDSSSLLFLELAPPRAVPRPLPRVAPRGPRGADIAAAIPTDLYLLG